MNEENIPILIGLGIILLMIKRTRPVLEGYNIKNDFWVPCNDQYAKAVNSLKFVCNFHNPEVVLKEFKKDVLGY